MIKAEGGHFKDETGRTLLLRGVNLGGSSKVPSRPNGATWNRADFYAHRDVSFVGRPFPLAEADEHFHRLRAWGFTFLRLLTTWEAIEHAGPGCYDTEYLEYLRAIAQKAGEHGLDLLIDPHQDAWSRFTGGDGAPGWTLEAVGFDLTQLHATGAALLHQEHGDPFPRMIWPTNYDKLAAGTMFTLFFAGDDFAPQLTVAGVPIQEYLQSHYCGAVQQVALALRDLPNVVGYDSLNEPYSGFIGASDVNLHANSLPLLKGESPTLWQSLLLGSGYPQRVPVYDIGWLGIRQTGVRLVNPGGARAWLPGRDDLWRQHGVWGVDAAGQPVVLDAGYFSRVHGRAVDFHVDYFKPFANRFARAIRAVAPEALIFLEGVPSQGVLQWDAADAPNVVHAPHWYDALTLLTKSFHPWVTLDKVTRRPVVGPGRVRRCFAEQLAALVREADECLNHAPTLIGEVGIPFDLHHKQAYRTGDFSAQIQALDTTLTALEMNCASFTLWNYTADNSNARGDHWNDEDLSLFSRDQMTGTGTVYDGGRALEAAVRPYPRKIAGEPVHLAFDRRRTTFTFTFRHAAGVAAPTEIFVPTLQYPAGCRVEVSDGTFELDSAGQMLRYWHTPERPEHTVRVTPPKA